MLSPLLQVYKRCNLEFTSGKGVFLRDKKRRKYMDLGAGVAVNSFGYAYPKLVKTLIKAAKKPWHVSNIYQISGQNKLADKLTKNSCCDQVFFCNSGTEATETAVKIVRKYFSALKKPNKKEIITFPHAFHGRTLAAISASGNKKFKEGYEPLVDGFVNLAEDEISIVKIKKKINKNTAAIFIEPIQGEGGVNQFSNKFLKDLDLLCKDKKILLIVDEVQCGAGRTGKLFHYQWANIKPDIITAAKGIGGGFPLGACIVKKEIGAAMTPGSHGGTYGGNPLAMSIGNAVIDEILKPKFLDKVKEKGDYFKKGLEQLQKKYPETLIEVRGAGLLLGLKVTGDYIKLVELLREQRLLTIPAENNVIRVLPPLIISKKEINFAIENIDKALEKFTDQND